MRKIVPLVHFPFLPRLMGRFRIAWLAAVCAVLAALLWTGPVWGQDSDFLIASWQEHEGIPENSALAVAQTPDGYLWVGSPDGLLRFNGINFSRAENFTDLGRLNKVVPFLETDHSGRLWAQGDGRLALYDRGAWQRIGGTNLDLRSVAEDLNGQVLLGGTGGQLYAVIDGKVEKRPAPDTVMPSGMFCITDARDGRIWLANRGFIGRLTPTGWVRSGPAQSSSKPLLAAPAQAGGIWVYIPGELRHYQADGTMKGFPAPDLDQPRELMEDRSGTIWIASISSGLTLLRPGGERSAINVTNGLAYNAIRCLAEDREGNVWAGGSHNGLNRLKPRQFATFGRAEGLPDNIVRTVAESSPGQVIVGTYGGGLARIQSGRVEPPPLASGDSLGRYVLSLLRDRSGRLWIGTFNDGLWVLADGVKRPFPLPTALSRSVAALMEDSYGRIWVGCSAGLGLIEGGVLTDCFTNSEMAGAAVTSLAEDPKSGAIWVGTYAHGLVRMDGDHFAHLTQVPGLPGDRISSLTMDDEGYLWVGIFGHGLACVHNGKTTLIGSPQGLPADTVGSILDDGRGWFWLGTTHGILRVTRADLRRLERQSSPPAIFNLFTVSDGLASDYCAEGYQPTALRDGAGRLWFGTDRGVVTVDPAQLRLNTNPPPVLIEQVGYTDRSGTNHVSLKPYVDKLVMPPGSVELDFIFSALSYTGPEKASYAYLLENVDQHWISMGNHHELHFRELPPGNYTLHLKAANNDGVWNDTGTALAFTIQPFLWQTLWFRSLALLALVGGGGWAIRRVTRWQYQWRIDQLQRERRLEQEHARLATIMETERQQAEAALEHERSLLRTLIDLLPDYIFIKDTESRFLVANQSLAKSYRCSPADLLHHRDEEMMEPALAAKCRASELKVLAADSVCAFEDTVTLPDGQPRTISTNMVAFRNSQGQVAGLVGIGHDITERKRAEEAHARLATVVEQATEIIVITDTNGTILYVNPSFERITGYTRAEAIGQNPRLLKSGRHDPEFYSRMWQTLKRGEVWRGHFINRRKDGTFYEEEATISPVREAAGEVTSYVGVKRDVTREVQLEADLRQAQKMEAIGQLAGGVAHDFNNILSSLLMQTDLIGMTDPLPAEVREGLQQIAADTRRAADLTRQLLLFSRRQVMQSRLLDVNEVVLNLARMLQRIIREDVRLQLHLHPAPLTTFADTGMLEQVLMNLAVNARDAMPKGGQLLIETAPATVDANDARLHPDAAPGRYVCLSVTDTGSGIPPEILPRIFEPFFTTKEPGKGTGLGLATVFGIVKQHQGWLKLENRPGQGATFRVYLPAGRAAAAELVATPAKPKPSGGTETILLVEDELAVRKPTRRILERHGYQVLEAADGAEALKLWRAHRDTVALLLTDLVMPGGLGGLELGRRLKAEQPGLKVIFASGYSADIAGRDFNLQPGEAFVQKPFATDHLLETIRRCLEIEI
jgi:PAS domain S-box-containing protein